MAYSKTYRQRIIDDYLNETGENLFQPGEFIDWLSQRPEHEAYQLFFGKGDEHAAREHRIGMARSMANGLRITVRTEDTQSSVVRFTMREFPMFVSPVDGRRSGGGYQAFDPQDAAALEEILRQGRTALRSWLQRYSGAFDQAGVDLSGLKEIAVEDRVVKLA